ncbi:LOW QUALITY PROTEIN: leucine-rich repeats and immunoglobulin-like domains protein 2 [Nylanderia fulva]|uniref:LOW QUALITY PROTEIN: leucine-rich repeats and immunoglobulin-like domains protein 2 n=1 Tax=Nylanderia fulva TaxID=613905 RepID=UPI0010FB7CDF|nr:LOW QUALITY PROTEIN: leucine-rich repeats and immunoglobulin-like domains protein 2 [Nylanderia fulva]
MTSQFFTAFNSIKIQYHEVFFTIIIFVYCSTLSRANDLQISLDFPNYTNEFGHHQCEDDIALNFSNTVITSIGQNFISNPLITCLNLTNIGIQSIQYGAFNKLPNLTQLFLSNNNINLEKLFDFGSHENLKVLILNSANTERNYYDHYSIHFQKYPNLEILSLRRNGINDLQTSIKEISFPKLKILDLSSNKIQGINFLELLPNSLYILDLHHNSLASLAFDKKKLNLLALNLDNNNLRYVKKYIDSHNRHNYGYGRKNNDQYISHNNPRNFGLAMAGLEKLHYLSISGNNIDFVESDAFEDINKLVYLNLSVNNINYLHPETFEKLQCLKSLDLSRNKLEDIPRISSETVISILSLNSNNVKSLIANAFAEMPKLTKLLLRGNQIVEINVKAFAELSLLEVLDLSKNKLSFLPKGWSDSFMSLKYLHLNDNQFTSLESVSLASALLSLIEVNLAINPLEYLDVSYFKNLPQNLTVNLVQKSI